MISSHFAWLYLHSQMYRQCFIIFVVWGVDAESEMIEKSAFMNSLQGITTGKGIFLSGENTNSVQTEVECVKMCFNTLW